MPKFEYNPEAMDAAAKKAEEELAKLDQTAVLVLAAWWYKFYLDAGHKRLGKLLVARIKAI